MNHPEDLQGYYEALVTHPHHNYYFGRHEADITSWLDYFLKGMVVVFERVAKEVERQSQLQPMDENLDLLRPLDHRARRVLGLFRQRDVIKSSDVASLLAVSTRQARELLTKWVAQGWLEISDPSRRGRKYHLAETYRKLVE
jgi:Fic family protein